MDKYVTIEDFNEYKKMSRDYTDAVIAAMIKTFHPLDQRKWDEFCGNFADELHERDISMGEDCIGKKLILE